MIGNGEINTKGRSRRRTQSESATTSRAPSNDESDTWAESGLPTSQLLSPCVDRKHSSCCVLSKEHVNFLAERTVKDWRRILRHLGVEQHVIDAIEVDFPHSSVERAYQGYTRWQRSNSKGATICAVFDVLDSVKRSDLRVEMEKTFSIEADLAQKKSLYMASVKYFIGRSDEIRRIQEFCEKKQRNKNLLCVNGLPGSGKKELIIEAVNKVDRSMIVKPNFMMEDKYEWSLKDLLDCILKELRKFVSHDISGKVNVCDLLVDLEKPCVLILEIAHLNLSGLIFNQIWTLIHDVLRNNKNKLKIIATSCRHPDEILCDTINYEVISLCDLSLDDSFKLLKRLNPMLSKNQIEDIYKCLGGNPLLLRKISVRIKSFDNHDEEMDSFIKSIQDFPTENAENTNLLRRDSSVHEMYHRQESNIHIELCRLVKNTNWWHDMTCVFNMMDWNEKVVLAKVSVVHGDISKRSFASIFGDEHLSKDAENLCINHCILRKANKSTSYSITEFYKTFIIKHIEDLNSTEGNSLKEIRGKSKIDVMNYYLKLLVGLSKLFFSRSTKKQCNKQICDHFVKDFRDMCTTCKEQCQCANFTVSKGIFFHHRRMLVRSLNKVMSLNNYAKPLFLNAFDCVHFLRHVLDHKQLIEVYDQLWNLAVKSDEEKAVALACLVFIRIHKGKNISNEQSMYIQMLNQSIEVLEARVEPPIGYQEVLLACYLKKASILSNAMKNFEGAKKVIVNAKQLLSKPGVKAGKFSYFSVVADCFCGSNEYMEAKKRREEQVKTFNLHIGNHALTAKSHYLLGKVYEKLHNHTSAIKSYNEALQMYHTLNYYPIQYGEVSYALGRLLLSRKRNYEAGKVFEHGKLVLQKLSEKSKNKSYLLAQCSHLISQISEITGKNFDDDIVVEHACNRKKSMKSPEYFLKKRRFLGYNFFLTGNNFQNFALMTAVLFMLLFLCVDVPTKKQCNM